MRVAFILAIAGLAPTLAQTQTQEPAPCLDRPAAQRPYTRERLLTMDSAQGPDRAEYLVRTCGVRDFFSPELESDLKKAGAEDGVMRAVREVAPPKPEIPKAPKEPAPKPADTSPKVNPKDGLTYVWIPPGKFTMGCSPGDTCRANEEPAHEVRIGKGFWLSRTETTQAAYRKVTGKDPSHFKGDDLPVEQVNWDEAVAYCRGIGGRLPTEAEWEYAARGGTKGAQYGDLEAIAWYGGNSDSKTHPVGKNKQENAFGLYDMLGNVWEWTADWYGEKYYEQREGIDPKGPATGTYRTLRGGSWNNYPSNVRASIRSGFEPGVRFYSFGFRCLWE